MGSNDTLKTAKIVREAEDQSLDGHQDKSVRKARRKERQKGKKVIKEALQDIDDDKRKKCR